MGTASQSNFGEFDVLVHDVKAIAQNAVENGTAMHTVEKQLLEKLMQLGHAAIVLNGFLHERVPTLSCFRTTCPLSRWGPRGSCWSSRRTIKGL